MAESYSVKAVLSAEDKNFTSTFEKASGLMESIQGKLSGGLGFGVLAGIGGKVFDKVSSGIGDMVGELNKSSASWKTFEGNMGILGKSSAEIATVKKDLQDFAAETIYSASDMSMTYSQLAAVGVKSADKLVKGFGGLAASAENPTQAMKTLSQQATQMAARPYVAWQDLKLMLDQAPAGIAAVAKEMGMTTDEMIASVQNGTLATEDFFNAVEKVGTSEGFSNMARQYKTTGEAMSGLMETMNNKLGPSFDKVSAAITGCIEKMIDWISQMDTSQIEAFATKAADSITKVFDFVTQHWDTIKNVALSVGILAGSFKALSFLDSFNPFGIFGKNADKAMKGTRSSVGGVGRIIASTFKGIGNVVVSAGKGISTAATGIGRGLSTALKGASSAAKGIGQGLSSAFKGLGTGISNAFRGISQGLALLNPATILATGAAIALVVASLSLLASQGYGLAPIIASIGTAIGNTAPAIEALGNAISAVVTSLGGAIAEIVRATEPIFKVFADMFVQIAPIIADTAVQIVEALVPVAPQVQGMVEAISQAIQSIAQAFVDIVGQISPILDSLCQIIEQAGNSISTVFESIGSVIESIGTGIKSVLEGIAGIFDSIGNAALNAGLGFKQMAEGVKTITELSLGDMATSLGTVATGLGGIAAHSGGLQAVGAAISVLGAGMSMISASASGAASAMTSMVSAAVSTTGALNQVGAVAVTAMATLIGAITNAAGQASGAGRQIGDGVKSGVQSGLSPVPKIANTAMNGFVSAMQSGSNRAVSVARNMSSSIQSVLRTAGSGAYSSGYNIGAGLASGMYSALGSVRAAASALVAEADRAIRAKAMIHSPAKLTKKEGGFFGEGWVVGIEDKIRRSMKVGQELVNRTMNAISGADPTLSYSGGTSRLNKEYNYNPTVYVHAEVKSIMDGREVGYGSARYVQEKNDFEDKRKDRLGGKNNV